MRVAFLVHSLGLWGGVGVVVEHARALRAEHDVDARLVLTRPERTADWGGHGGLAAVPVLTLQEARDEHWDIVVATWWETVFTMHELLLRALRLLRAVDGGALLRARGPARGAAALTHDLPLAFITEARWMVEQLTARRPGQAVPTSATASTRTSSDRCRGAGAPHRRAAADPRRGQPGGGDQGRGEALAAAAAMHEPHTVTLVCGDREAPRGAPRRPRRRAALARARWRTSTRATTSS